MARAKNQSAEEPFEKSLLKLEEIVQKLEEEEISLEASLKLYEEGQRLVRVCEGKLRSAENRIKQLLENEAGEIEEADFAAGATEDDEAVETETPKPARPETASKDDLPF
jgi:exodeoxyribonuclease VII small subunit